MKEYSTSQIRNVAVAGHSDAGKSSLIESILFNLKLTDRLGSTTDGNLVTDYETEEIKRRVSINSSLIPIEHKGVKINILDLPGYRDFVGDIRQGMRVSDAAIVVLDASAGMEMGAELAYEYAQEFEIPVIFVINKVDHERAGYEKVMQKIRDTFGCTLAQMNMPVGEGASFTGAVNLLNMKMASAAGGGKTNYVAIPDEESDRAKELHAALVEFAAEGDDELTMKFLDGEQLSDEEILRGLRTVVTNRRVCPVIASTALQGVGVNTLLDLIALCVPSPDQARPFVGKAANGDPIEFKYDEKGSTVAYVFKTISDPFAGRLTFFKVLSGVVRNDTVLTNNRHSHDERISHLMTVRGKKQDPVTQVSAGDIGVLAKLGNTLTGDVLSEPKKPVHVEATTMPKPVVQMAIKAKSKDDEEKIGIAMHRLIEQDPTLNLYRDPAIRQTILTGMGDTHLDVAVSRLKNQNKVEVELEIPRVPYRETLTKKAEGEGKHKKQSGGRGQFGDCWLRLEPNTEGAGFEFNWEIVGGVIPTKFQPSVEKGIVQSMERGIIAGYQVVDVKVACYDGKFHAVDSSDMAFQVAASKGFKTIAKQAGPVILEPIYKLKVVVPEQYMGDVMGDLNSKRGRILGMGAEGRKQVVEALVPLSEMFEFSRELRSISQGRGMFEMEYHHYERVPAEVQAKIVAASAPEEEEED